MGDSEGVFDGRISIERTGRFWRLDRRGEQMDSPVWLLLHGYGEVGDEFLDRCSGILAGCCGELIAPEGVSRFYTKGGRGPIGASWMTSLMREDEIDEYIEMIETVLQACKIPETTPLNILGFSQGGATGMRFALRTSRPIRQLILWGAGFEAGELGEWRGKLSLIEAVQLVAGEKDRIVRREVIDRTAEAIDKLGGRAEVLIHPGGHELDSNLLEEIGRSAQPE